MSRALVRKGLRKDMDGVHQRPDRAIFGPLFPYNSICPKCLLRYARGKCSLPLGEIKLDPCDGCVSIIQLRDEKARTTRFWVTAKKSVRPDPKRIADLKRRIEELGRMIRDREAS